MKRTRGEKIFNVVNLAFLGGVALVTLYPFIYVMLASMTCPTRDGREVTFKAYELVLGNPEIMTALGNTAVRTVLATALTLLVSCLAAYALARKHLPHRGMVLFLILFTMIFNGGIVPSYLLIRNLGLIDSIWSLVLPLLVSAFNLIIIKNFFQQIPESLTEAARVEGASETAILFRIFLPLSMPVLATVALWTAVMHWNQWFDAMLYIYNDDKQVLQTLLQRIVIQNSTAMQDRVRTGLDISRLTPESVKAATVMVTVLPIAMLYPFVQRYFVKGILLGGVKE